MFDNLLSLQDVYSTIIKSSPMEILHWNSDPFAVVLSGYLSSLQQLWVLGPKWKKNGQHDPQNVQTWYESLKTDWNWFIFVVQALSFVSTRIWRPWTFKDEWRSWSLCCGEVPVDYRAAWAVKNLLNLKLTRNKFWHLTMINLYMWRAAFAFLAMFLSPFPIMCSFHLLNNGQGFTWVPLSSSQPEK